jgi:hypothetical protein
MTQVSEIPVAIVVHWEERKPASDTWESKHQVFPIDEDTKVSGAIRFVSEELWGKRPFQVRGIHYTNRYVNGEEHAH